ncbi:hypothetical protein [Streptomyces boncukensis]|uniref:Uncharacterized protein n=1 Tax=Streptomyces boncukensis TaxID=2711219 RepID=A0A6G4XA53_9ACTN|nr:hypothetical protein [Streptomyces boncukensis]NGO74032.1 hypothetical protein [Streptomyces boncukensis]
MNTASVSVHAPVGGATAVSGSALQGSRHRAGGLFRAIRVFAGAAFSVAVLGDYEEHETPLVRRTR